MIKYLFVTIFFTIAYCGFSVINFYQAKNIIPNTKNLILYNLCIIPITFILNLVVTFTFNKGQRAFGKMLPVTIIYLGVGVFSYTIMNYFFFREIPRWNNIIAIILVFIALILANLNNT